MDENYDIPVEYDMSFSTNARINYLLWKGNESMEKEDPLEWMKVCKNILKECSTNMKDEEMKIHRDNLKEIEKALNEFQQYQQMFILNKGSNYNPPRVIFDKLYDWELLLRKKLDKMGLLFRKGDDITKAMIQ